MKKLLLAVLLACVMCGAAFGSEWVKIPEKNQSGTGEAWVNLDNCGLQKNTFGEYATIWVRDRPDEKSKELHAGAVWEVSCVAFSLDGANAQALETLYTDEDGKVLERYSSLYDPNSGALYFLVTPDSPLDYVFHCWTLVRNGEGDALKSKQ